MVRLRLSIVLVVCFAPTAILAQAIIDFRVVTPRHFGYTIGDEFRHEMHLVLAMTHSLDSATLPQTGRINRWLEISHTDIEIRRQEQTVNYRIVVQYRIINAPRKLTSVTVPQLEFAIIDGAHRIPVFLPEWAFSVGPIAPVGPLDTVILQPDHLPQSVPVIGRQIRLQIMALLLGGLLIYLAYLRWVLPRLKRERFPFSVALRALRQLQRQEVTPAIYLRGIQVFHAAVNVTAGQVIFCGNLDALFAARSEFLSLKSGLSTLYSRSRDLFFNDEAVAQPDVSLRELIDLCRHCRNLERSGA